MLRHSLDRCNRSHRHKDRRFNRCMRQRHGRAARGPTGVMDMKL
jgi:hypothetical protein